MRPYILAPGMSSNPNTGENHRTVCIRAGRSSISIKCPTRAQAERLGKTLVGALKIATTPPQGKPVDSDLA